MKNNISSTSSTSSSSLTSNYLSSSSSTLSSTNDHKNLTDNFNDYKILLENNTIVELSDYFDAKLNSTSLINENDNYKIKYDLKFDKIWFELKNFKEDSNSRLIPRDKDTVIHEGEVDLNNLDKKLTYYVYFSDSLPNFYLKKKLDKNFRELSFNNNEQAWEIKDPNNNNDINYYYTWKKVI